MQKTVLFIFMVFCSFSCISIEKDQKTISNENNDVEKIIQDFSSKWIGIEGVVAVAEGRENDQACIHLYISKEFSSEIHPIPESYKGVKVKFEETDILESL